MENQAPQLVEVEQQNSKNVQKYVVDGITIIENDEVPKKIPQVTAEFLHGMPKSGKPWKKNSKQGKAKIRVNKGLCKTWEEKQVDREKRKTLIETIKNITENNESKIKSEKKRLSDKKKQKEINELKSGSFQVIKNTKKISKWNRRARSQLSRLPSELYEQVLKKEYGY